MLKVLMPTFEVHDVISWILDEAYCESSFRGHELN